MSRNRGKRVLYAHRYAHTIHANANANTDTRARARLYFFNRLSRTVPFSFFSATERHARHGSAPNGIRFANRQISSARHSSQRCFSSVMKILHRANLALTVNDLSGTGAFGSFVVERSLGRIDDEIHDPERGDKKGRGGAAEKRIHGRVPPRPRLACK